MCATVPAYFFFLVERGICYVIQAGLELLSSSDLPALAFQTAGITGMSHREWPVYFYILALHWPSPTESIDLQVQYFKLFLPHSDHASHLETVS